jgi:predicted O-methyltransferase YrrM
LLSSFVRRIAAAVVRARRETAGTIAVGEPVSCSTEPIDPEFVITVAPLAKIDIADDLASMGPITPANMLKILESPTFKDLVEPFFAEYPRKSLMSCMCRSVIFTLARVIQPMIVVEIGTFYAGTAEVIARALWENGKGHLYTIDPFGQHRCPLIIKQWPEALTQVTTYLPYNSMQFFGYVEERQEQIDMILVDGNHDLEYAYFDLAMAARLLRPGGIVVMDNVEQSGPFGAARRFLVDNPDWTEIGDAIRDFDMDRPFDPRASIQFTTFLILKSPESYLLAPRVYRSTGLLVQDQSGIRGFSISPLPGQGRGKLNFQVCLRGFADNASPCEIKWADCLDVDATCEGQIEHLFKSPLDTGYHDLFAESRHMVEIELFWRPLGHDTGLYLAAPPKPIA